MTVASGPLPNAGSAPSLDRSHGSDIATSVATVDAAKMLVDTVSATGRSAQRRTAGKASSARMRPRISPVASSLPTIRRTGTPTDSPLTTRTSVCVPTASAM